MQEKTHTHREDPEPAVPGLDLPGLRTDVDRALEDFLRQRATELATIDEDLVVQLDFVVDLISGGKRLRPAFAYWGWRGAGGEPDDTRMIVAAAALELLQAAALVHDDVMDDSDTRRGRPAVHKRFATLHGERGWEGPAERFGLGGALLLGDLCLCWSDEMLRGCGLPPDRLLPAFGYFDTMRTEVMAGQYLDLVTQASGSTSLPRAMRVVRYKSAKYTVERPLHLGGALAGARPDLLSAYSAYGLPLGEAFQLRDDILGVFGDPTVTGKPAGDDLREGKRTVLAAEALEAATPAQVRRFERWFGDPATGSQGVAELREIIVASGALAAVERMISDLTAQASQALARAPLADEGARDALARLARAATDRTG
ncbi:polyprenyl synthetase family protein [Actinopolymorpha pittospori]|uniref:Geranylgeranyl diphosphate synthase type I n=1 Tax=Actinopolymorpha pittospori TaxID=648752 RepID=A0A927RDB6_9ACTN|nr:geranylgeranyl diphosphate synthase type I [Actinopolymorpha pittospori]